MDPATIALAASAVSAAGAAVKGYAQVQQLDAQVGAARYNQRLELNQAQSELAAGTQQEAQIREQGRAQLGNAFAAAGQSGTRGGTTAGTVRNVALQAELDAENAQFNADTKARARTIAAQEAGYSADVAQAQIPGVELGTGISVAADLAGGYGKSLQLAKGYPTIE